MRYILSFLLAVSAAFYSNESKSGDAENRIVAQCMANSGGQAAAFAACTFRDLTVAEIKKCFDGTGCYGEGNTLVQFSNWFNRNVLGGCGFQPAGHKVQYMVMNNSSVTIEYWIESEFTDWDKSVLNPGQYDLWTLDICDTFVNIAGVGEEYGYNAGGIMEFADGNDGYVHQYVIFD